MQLFYAPRSPFSRKILATIVELDLTAQVSLVQVDPWTDETLRRHNPACKVPTLVLHDSSALFDSPVIARYLDALSGHTLIPSGPQTWDALRREALGDALAEAVIRRFVDQLGPHDDRLERAVARQEAAIFAGLAYAPLDYAEPSSKHSPSRACGQPASRLLSPGAWPA